MAAAAAPRIMAASGVNISLQSNSTPRHAVPNAFLPAIPSVKPQSPQIALSSVWLGCNDTRLLGLTLKLPNTTKAAKVYTIQAAALGENEYEIEIEKPYGIKFYKGDDNGVYIDAIAVGQSAARSGAFTEGDRVLATSAVFGDEMWPAAEYGRTMYCIRQRVGNLVIRMEKRYGQKQPVAKAKEEYLLERNAGNYGDAIREKQIENYLQKVEMEEQRTQEMAAGLSLYKQGKYEEALVRFETVIVLQPSRNEQAVTSYNVACCYSKLGEIDAGLAALEAAMEKGFEDYKTIREDPDLEALRGSENFKPLLNKYDEPFINENAMKALSSVFGIFGGKK